jgi:purine-binding chemotaxis protein CheW
MRLGGKEKRRVESQNISGEVEQLISFVVGGEEHGFELKHAKEVIRMREVTRLPEAPAYTRGITNLRGHVIPIVDIREKFCLEITEATPATRVIMLEVESSAVGIVVDSTSQIMRCDARKGGGNLPMTDDETMKAIWERVLLNCRAGGRVFPVAGIVGVLHVFSGSLVIPIILLLVGILLLQKSRKDG